MFNFRFVRVWVCAKCLGERSMVKGVEHVVIGQDKVLHVMINVARQE